MTLTWNHLCADIHSALVDEDGEIHADLINQGDGVWLASMRDRASKRFVGKDAAIKHIEREMRSLCHELDG